VNEGFFYKFLLSNFSADVAYKIIKIGWRLPVD